MNNVSSNRFASALSKHHQPNTETPACPGRSNAKAKKRQDAYRKFRNTNHGNNRRYAMRKHDSPKDSTHVNTLINNTGIGAGASTRT